MPVVKRNPNKPVCSFITFTKLPSNFNTDILTDIQYEKALLVGVIALIELGEITLQAEMEPFHAPKPPTP